MPNNIKNRYGTDWQDRILIPDVYPRNDDPYAPPGSIPPPTGTQPSNLNPTTAEQDLYQQSITTPGVRPVVFQRAYNTVVTVTGNDVGTVPLMTATYQCDAFLIDVPSSSTNSAFFGFGAGVTPASGIEVQPGLPQFYSPTNIREQWELQRLLEAICALIGFQIGQVDGMPPIPTPGQYMAPRVVLNAHDYYLVNNVGITQNVSVMLFTVPEFQ